jgi:triosephosphate isomerase (TIM)
MQRPVFAANWKMNHGPTAARAFVAEFTARWSPRSDRTVLLFPPALSVTAVVAALSTRSDIGVGVQNIWTEDKGAFTGENSAPMARDAGARFALVGHSERRHVFGESDEQTALKCAAAARNDLVPILCIGELLSQRESGQTESVVLRQLETGLSKLSPSAISTMAIAYEPVWAIGTGKTATPEDASTVHAAIRAVLRSRVGDAGGAIPILYGGSVSSGNAGALLAANGVDGLLVGGASLAADDWVRICGT